MKNTKKDLSKFSKRNTHKRRSKERAMRELRAAVLATGVEVSPSLSLRSAVDSGRRGRSTHTPRHDEEITEGIFSAAPGGFGFVAREGDARDVFIPEDRVGAALDGDLVEAVYHSFIGRDGSERTEGRITKILNRERKCAIGTLWRERGRRGYRYVLIPDDPKLPIRPEITDTAGASDGDKVQVKLRRADRAAYHTGEVVAVFGEADSREANYGAILAECEIPTDFSDEAMGEAEELSKKPLDTHGRVDLTKQTVFTIDGADAKDLDDAVSLCREGGGYCLCVHIADVSEYVPERCALDRAVMQRGTSVYFTDKVIPMLPACLSNGACSLHPGSDKAALTAKIHLSHVGEIQSCEIFHSVIRSCVRGVYSEVNRIFDGTADPETREKYSAVTEELSLMRELYTLLLDRALTRGYIDMEIPEAKILLDGGEPVDIIKRERGIAERMIEQFMLTANEAVATLLSERGIPCVYRVHEPPAPERLEGFADYARSLGLDTRGIMREGADSRDFAGLLSVAEERGIGEQVAGTMLRAMSKAKYSSRNGGHFGLGLGMYCHFTSPIRRLSDLATHRIIHKVLLGGTSPEKYRSYAARAAAAASDTELRAVNAERRIENLYKVIYMQKFLGQEYRGVVDSVASFGIFVRLENTCEGLIPASDLGFSVFDERHLTLRAGSRVFRIGDELTVRLLEADRARGKLRFSLVR